jgi:DNA-binding HxlR family transcriptional regulator
MNPVRCSGNLPEAFQQAVSVLAKRWTPLILFVLSDGPRRFSEIAEQIEFVSDRMLSERLKELEAAGLVERHVYPEVPVRVEYHLTEKGRELDPIFEAIAQWAARWMQPSQHASGTTNGVPGMSAMPDGESHGPGAPDARVSAELADPAEVVRKAARSPGTRASRN